MTCKYATHVFVVERELVNIVLNSESNKFVCVSYSQAHSLISTLFFAINLIYQLVFG